MKKTIRFFGIIAILAIIGFSACDNDSTHSHDWGSWSVTTPATCIAEGVETRVCTSDPTHTETRPIVIDTNAHTWSCNHIDIDEQFEATFANTSWTYSKGVAPVYTFGSFNSTAVVKLVLTITSSSVSGVLPGDTYNILEYTKGSEEGLWNIKLLRVSNSSEFTRGFKVSGNTLTFINNTTYGASQDYPPFSFTKNN